MPANRKAQIERINQVSAMARTSWIALLGYLAFIGVTLLGVEDADFFVPSRQTQLPLVNVSIPTASFFIFAPILAAALYIYLHIILLKLWDAIADVREPEEDDQSLGDAINPWLVNDWALTFKGGAFTPARPLRTIGNIASFLLVWAAAPLVLFFFWWWSMPAHRPLLTTLLAVCFLATLHAGYISWRAASAWLKQPRSEPKFSRWLHRDIGYLGAALLCVTLLMTAWPFEIHMLGGTYSTMSEIDFRRKKITRLPDYWRECDIAKREFRSQFAERERIEGIGAWSSEMEQRFEDEWSRRRTAEVNSLETIDLSDADLRKADFSDSTAAGLRLPPLPWNGAVVTTSIFDGSNYFNNATCSVNWTVVSLQGMSMREARLSGADLTGARLGWTDLSGARLEGANLFVAQMEEASLIGARLNGANLEGAQLEGANLRDTRLEGANLAVTNLERANFIGARLQGAYLIGARLQGADLRYADFRSSTWYQASNQGSPAHFADLRGVKGLTQGHLEELIGNKDTLIPDVDAPDTGEPFVVWSCWDTPPQDFDALVERASQNEGRSADEIRSEFLCGPDNLRSQTGNALPLDAPYPSGHPLAGR